MMENIIAYAENGTVPDLTGFELIVFSNICKSIDKSLKSYDERVGESKTKRIKGKVADLYCCSCKKNANCKRKKACKQNGKCDFAEHDNATESRLEQCQNCALLSACKNKYRFVKNKQVTSPCETFEKSANKKDYCYSYNDSIDNTTFSSINISENSISIPSSSKEKRKVSGNFSGGGDVGGEDSSLYVRKDVIDRLESRGVERQWAESRYDDLKASNFRSGRNPITDIISYMMAQWEKFRNSQEKKKKAVAEMKEQEQAEKESEDKKLGRGAYAVPQEYLDIVKGIKDEILKKDLGGSKFMDAFRLCAVTDSQIVVGAPSAAAFDVYSQVSNNEFEALLLEALPGRSIVHRVLGTN